jgi:hypothetical protein
MKIFGEVKNSYGVLTWKPEERAHMKDLGVDGGKYLNVLLRNRT